MTDDTLILDEDADLKAAELEALKDKATQLGIKFHPSIGEDKLREKINEALEEEDLDAGEDTPPEEVGTEKETQAQFNARKKAEASELVRVRITCMNPNKREWEGEIFTAGNAVVGTFRKMVPFNVEWHVPRIILNQIKQRQCQVFFTARNEKGQKFRKGKQIAEFAIEELPALTEKDLKELAQRQAMATGTAGV